MLLCTDQTNHSQNRLWEFMEDEQVLDIRYLLARSCLFWLLLAWYLGAVDLRSSTFVACSSMENLLYVHQVLMCSMMDHPIKIWITRCIVVCSSVMYDLFFRDTLRPHVMLTYIHIHPHICKKCTTILRIINWLTFVYC